MIPTPTKTLPARAFDCDMETAAPNIAAVIRAVTEQAKTNGLDVEALCAQVSTIDKTAAPALLKRLHDAAALFFLQWQRAVQHKQQTATLAYARLVNRLTYEARALNDRFSLIDWAHIESLRNAIAHDLSFAPFGPEALGMLLDNTARQHTHERAWPWVVLPTFARQPYGRILLTTVDIPDCDYPLIITQPFFLPGQSTLFHTHGQNWAYSRPLGDANGKNVHINTLWMPNTHRNPFPLRLLDNTEYASGEVAILPPRAIHGIARKRCWREAIPTLRDLLGDEALRARWVAKPRFGELACMHIYCPCLTTADRLRHSPFVLENEKFFIEYDMIVFDHFGESIWSGGGGSWPRRMIEYGTTGDHCGICFEEDARKENLDPATVARWFVQEPPPQLIKMGMKTTV